MIPKMTDPKILQFYTTDTERNWVVDSYQSKIVN